MTILAFNKESLLNCRNLEPISEGKIKSVWIDLQSIRFLTCSLNIDSSEAAFTITLSMKTTTLYEIQRVKFHSTI